MATPSLALATRHARLLIVASLGVFTLAACAGRQAPPPRYSGPTLTLAELVRDVNRNNEVLPTLFSRIYVEANIYDPDKKRFVFVNSGGDLFLRKPRELLLRGKKDVAGDVFQLGSTDERYWLSVFVEGGTMWWGWQRNVGKPCARGMPVRPDLIGEVLGVGDINADLKQLPAPTLRYNNDLDVYMLLWIAKLPDRWYAEKEIWYDRATLRPRKVLLSDQNGRVLLRANLSRHQQVQVPGLAEAQRPWIATAYDLYFPETKSTMTLQLSDMALTSKTGQPKPGTIRFPEHPDVAKEIQIDEDCERKQ